MTTTSSTSGNTATIAWTFPSTTTVAGLTFSFNHVDANLGGVASNGRSGTGNETVTIGYSTTASYQVLAYYSRTGHSDNVLSDTGSVTTGPAPGGSAPPSTAASAYDAGNGNVTVTWDFTAYPGYSATSSGISGGAGTSYSGQVSGSATYFVGYSTTVTWYVTDNHGVTYSGPVTTGAVPGGGGGGGTTPPPAAPNPATGLSAVLTSATSVNLSWTASSGGADGYEIRRNGVALLTQVGTTYTDSAKPAGAVTYQVFAYSTSAGGTTYAAGTNAVTVGGVSDSCGILQG